MVNDMPIRIPKPATGLFDPFTGPFEKGQRSEILVPGFRLLPRSLAGLFLWGSAGHQGL
jgi:hypothetical protein